MEVEREWQRDRGRVLTPSASPLPSRSLSARVTLGPINLRRSVKQRRLDLIHQKSTWKTLEGPLARGNGNHIRYCSETTSELGVRVREDAIKLKNRPSWIASTGYRCGFEGSL